MAGDGEFATLGDLIVAEPEALIGFTGPVIKRQRTGSAGRVSACGVSARSFD